MKSSLVHTTPLTTVQTVPIPARAIPPWASFPPPLPTHPCTRPHSTSISRQATGHRAGVRKRTSPACKGLGTGGEGQMNYHGMRRICRQLITMWAGPEGGPEGSEEACPQTATIQIHSTPLGASAVLPRPCMFSMPSPSTTLSYFCSNFQPQATWTLTPGPSVHYFQAPQHHEEYTSPGTLKYQLVWRLSSL